MSAVSQWVAATLLALIPLGVPIGFYALGLIEAHEVLQWAVGLYFGALLWRTRADLDAS